MALGASSHARWDARERWEKFYYELQGELGLGVGDRVSPDDGDRLN